MRVICMWQGRKLRHMISFLAQGYTVKRLWNGHDGVDHRPVWLPGVCLPGLWSEVYQYIWSLGNSQSLAIAAAVAAKSLQLCLTLCNPIDGSPPGSSVPGILQARILEWVAISFSNACMHAKSLQSCLTLCDAMDSSPPDSSVHRFSRQGYWSGLPFPSPSSH